MSGEELQSFEETIRWLAIARKNLAAYPPGHPALAASFQKANQQLQEFLGAGGPLRISVIRNALLWGDEKLTSPQAQDLALILYRRDVAILQIEANIEPWELETLLRVISMDPRKTGETPLADLLASENVTHAQLGMANYESIRMTSEVRVELETEEKTELGWDSLMASLRAARGEARVRTEPGSEEISAFEVAAAIRKMFQEEQEAAKALLAADPALFFDPADMLARSPTLAVVLEAVTDYTRRLRTEDHRAAGQQVARLINLLPEEFRHPVLVAAMRAFTDDDEVREELRTLDAALAKEAALEALMQHPAEPPPPAEVAPTVPESAADTAPPPDDAELKKYFQDILEGEDVDRFNPNASRRSEELLGIRLPDLVAPEGSSPDLGDRPETLGEEPVLESLTQTLIEMLDAPPLHGSAPAVLGRLEEAFRYFLSSGLFEQAARLVEELKGKISDPGVATEVIVPIQHCLERLASGETVSTILEKLPYLGEQSLERVRQLVLALGPPAIQPFFSALAEEDGHSQRRRILDFLISLGAPIAPEARAHLTDSRWFIVRNMLYLLRSVGDRTSLPEVRRCVNHPEVRVRLEAIKTIYTFDTNVPRDLIWKTILDPDPKSAEAAVMLAGSYGIAEAFEPIVSILRRWDFFGFRRSLRLKALQSLGELGNARALEELKRYFKNWLFPVVAREERVAAYRSLENYPEEARRPFLEMGIKSRLPEVREICRGIAAGKRRTTNIRGTSKGKNG